MAVFGMVEGSIKVLLVSGGSLTVGISRSAGNAETFEDLGKAIAAAFTDATAKLHEGPCRDKIAALEKKLATMAAPAPAPAPEAEAAPVSKSSYHRKSK